MVDKNLQPAQEERHQFRRRPLQAKVYAACVCTLVEPTISVHSHSLASKFTHVRPNGVGVQKHVWVVLERKKKKRGSQFMLVAIVSKRKCGRKSLLLFVGNAYLRFASTLVIKRLTPIASNLFEVNLDFLGLPLCFLLSQIFHLANPNRFFVL